MFVKANVGSFFLGDALGSIMSGIVPEYEVNVSITLKEGALDRSPALDSIDQVELVFFRAQAQSMSLLGVSIEDPHPEMQYLPSRRRFDARNGPRKGATVWTMSPTRARVGLTRPYCRTTLKGSCRTRRR